MAVTQLSPTATPGRRYSFSAKDPAGSGKGTGPFTDLSVTATPGGRHSFSPKDAAGGGKGAGPFTLLSVTATPGHRYSFSAKDPAEEGGGGGGGMSRGQQRISDEQDVLDLLEVFFSTCAN